MELECTDCEEIFSDFLGYSICKHCRRSMEIDYQREEQQLENKTKMENKNDKIV